MQRLWLWLLQAMFTSRFVFFCHYSNSGRLSRENWGSGGDPKLLLFDIWREIGKRPNGQDVIQNASYLDKKLFGVDHAWTGKLCKISTYWWADEVIFNLEAKQGKIKARVQKLSVTIY